jgi:hypothetical protein
VRATGQRWARGHSHVRRSLVGAAPAHAGLGRRVVLTGVTEIADHRDHGDHGAAHFTYRFREYARTTLELLTPFLDPGRLASMCAIGNSTVRPSLNA